MHKIVLQWSCVDLAHMQDCAAMLQCSSLASATPYQPQHWMYYITNMRKEKVWSRVQGFVAVECDHKTTPNLIKCVLITAGGGLLQVLLVQYNMELCFCVLEVLTTNFLPGVDSSKLHTGYACRACTDRLLTLTSNLQNACSMGHSHGSYHLIM